MTGHRLWENTSDMLEKYPLASIPIEQDGSGGKITVPAYIVASYVSTLLARHVRRIPED